MSEDIAIKIIIDDIKPNLHPIHPKVYIKLATKELTDYRFLKIISQLPTDLQPDAFKDIYAHTKEFNSMEEGTQIRTYKIHKIDADYYQTTILEAFYNIIPTLTNIQANTFYSALLYFLPSDYNDIDILYSSLYQADPNHKYLKHIPKNIIYSINYLRILNYPDFPDFNPKIKINNMNLTSFNLTSLPRLPKKDLPETKLDNQFFTYYIPTATDLSKISKLKTIDTFKINNKTYISKVIRHPQELYNLTKMKHPNIAFPDFLIHTTPDILLYEDQNQQTLLNYITDATPISTRYNLIYQLLQTIRDLHANNVYHRDIKPNNIIVYQDETLKLIDLDRSHRHIHTFYAENEMHTPDYLPPECFPETPTLYNHRVDTFATLVTISFILTNKLYETSHDFLESGSLPNAEELTILIKDTSSLTINQVINAILEK